MDVVVDQKLTNVKVKGRGVAVCTLPEFQCLCQRQYSNILCQNCGHLLFGRVRYACPKHPQTRFLIDITCCPRCRAYEFMLFEIPK